MSDYPEYLMPIYEYQCQHCQHRFEELVSMTQPTVSCPKCKASNTEKLISLFASPSSNSQAVETPSGCGRCGHPQGPCHWN